MKRGETNEDLSEALFRFIFRCHYLRKTLKIEEGKIWARTPSGLYPRYVLLKRTVQQTDEEIGLISSSTVCFFPFSKFVLCFSV